MPSGTAGHFLSNCTSAALWSDFSVIRQWGEEVFFQVLPNTFCSEMDVKNYLPDLPTWGHVPVKSIFQCITNGESKRSPILSPQKLCCNNGPRLLPHYTTSLSVSQRAPCGQTVRLFRLLGHWLKQWLSPHWCKKCALLSLPLQNSNVYKLLIAHRVTTILVPARDPIGLRSR